MAWGPKTSDIAPVITADRLWYCTKKGEPNESSGYQWSKGESPWRKRFIACDVICKCMPLSLGYATESRSNRNDHKLKITASATNACSGRRPARDGPSFWSLVGGTRASHAELPRLSMARIPCASRFSTRVAGRGGDASGGLEVSVTTGWRRGGSQRAAQTSTLSAHGQRTM